MNQIQTRQLTSPPSLSADEAHELVFYRNAITGGVLTRGMAPGARERFESHLAAIKPYFAPASRAQIEDEVTVLMTAFFSARSVSKIEAQVTIRTYSEALSGSPLWAVKKAFRLVAQGKIEGASLDFPPAAPRLRAAVDEIMRDVTQEHFQIKGLLACREELESSPEQRSKVGELLYELSSSLKSMDRDRNLSKVSPPALSNKDIVAHYKKHELGREPKKGEAA
jgi:hypothetical protein